MKQLQGWVFLIFGLLWNDNYILYVQFVATKMSSLGIMRIGWTIWNRPSFLSGVRSSQCPSDREQCFQLKCVGQNKSTNMRILARAQFGSRDATVILYSFLFITFSLFTDSFSLPSVQIIPLSIYYLHALLFSNLHIFL